MIDTINPSITAGIGSGAGDPLNMIYKFAATQNALNQNALFQQTFRARQAMGPISQKAMQDATGPDGQPDMEKYYTNLAIGVSTHPDTAFIAPDVLNGLAQKRLIDAQTFNQKLESKTRQLGIASQVAAASLPDYDGSPGHDIGALMGKIHAAGGFESMDDLKKHIPWMATIDGKPIAEQRSQVAQLARSMNTGADLAQKITGTFGTVGYDPADGSEIKGWSSGVMGTLTPQMPGGAAVRTTPAAPGSVPQGAPSQPNFAPGAPSEAQKKVWSDTEAMREDYNAQDARGQQIQVVRKQLQNALDQIHAGAGAGAYQNFAQFLQSIGVGHNLEKPDKDILNAAANGSLPAGQTADSLSTLLGTMAVRDLLLSKSKDEGSAGRLTNLEFGKIVDQFPNKEKDPGYNTAMMNFMDRQYALRHLKAQTFNKIYNDYHGHQALPGGMTNPTQFEPYWGEQLMKNNAIPSLGGQ